MFLQMKDDEKLPPIEWVKRVNDTWLVRDGLDAAADKWLAHLQDTDARRLAAACAPDWHALAGEIHSIRAAEGFVCAIAKRRISGLLALAEPECFFLGNLDFHWLQPGALVRAVAERLMSGAPA